VNFFLLVLLLSIPFWIVGGVSGLELLPGLPLAALMSFCPALAACILIYREQGAAGVFRLLQRAADFRRIRSKIWYVPIIFLMPAIMLASYLIMRWMGDPLPAPEIPLLLAVPLLLAFLAGALGEELGWSAYATDRFQARWGELVAGLFLGVAWAVWHLVPLIQVHRPVDWIAGWSLGTVATRIIIVRLYNGTARSVFAAALYHAMSNVSWQLFPNRGSHYDPRVSGALLALVAVVVVYRRSRCEPGPRSPRRTC
jgi:membrane protease YdiL (CAAX protease family)